MRTFICGAFSLLLAAGFVAACEDTGEIGGPLSVSLTGPGTGLVAQDLPFQYAVEGRSLQGISLSWGDGAVDSITTAGAQTASGTRVHAYDSVGVYTLRLLAEDALEGVGVDEVTLSVQSN